MFSASSENATLSDETPTGSDTQRPTARRLGTRSSGLFAVPEDREVLRTPQENENSGFVFGQGPSGETENERAVSPDDVDGSLSAPPNVATETDREEDVQTEGEEMRTVTEVEVDEQTVEEVPSLPPISTTTVETATLDSEPGSPPARPERRRTFSPEERSPSPRPPRGEGFGGTVEDGHFYRLSDEDDGTAMETTTPHTNGGFGKQALLPKCTRVM